MKMHEQLKMIYSAHDAEYLTAEIAKKISQSKSTIENFRKKQWDEQDIVLITYGDQFTENNTPALQSLQKIYNSYFKDVFNITHILPFYPYSSDDGFSVIDYKQVKENFGDWQDVHQFSLSTRFMFDFVCNHISAKSQWFQNYLKNDPEYKDFFVEMDPLADVSDVTRPRSNPLLTPVIQENGDKKYVWTTFSEDQIDLNFASPKVLLAAIDVLLFYLEEKAEFIRLDAVGFLWKEIGTSSIHHEKTHQIVKLFRNIVEETAPGTKIITETNVPHQDNIAYFGKGNDEAHMVYQFPLPPLVLHAIHSGSGEYLSNWAKELPPVNTENTFFNFLASHDGIGLNPLKGIVPDKEIEDMLESLTSEGALVSYKSDNKGGQSPYEVNVTYLDALSRDADSEGVDINKFLLAHSILLTLPGVPAIYIQSILGSSNNFKGVEETGRNRSINREKFDVQSIEMELNQAHSKRKVIYEHLKELIQKRKNETALHPDSEFKIIDFHPALFSFERKNINGNQLLLIHNTGSQRIEIELQGGYKDLITDTEINVEKSLTIQPYQFLWLKNLS